jgi:hypothetical protein
MAFSFGKTVAKNIAKKFNPGLRGKPASNPLQTYANKEKTGSDASKEYLEGVGPTKNLTDDPAYQKAQAEREGAIGQQFESARTRLGQQEARTKEDISQGLQKLQARVGAVGGSVEKARAKSLQETGREYASQYGELAAQEAGAKSQLKGEDVQRRFESEQMNKQLDQQNRQFAASYGLNVDQLNEMKKQFGEEMKFKWAEFDENQKTLLLNATVALKKAGIDGKQISKYMDELTGYYGEERTKGLKPVTKGYADFLQGQRERYGIKGTPKNVWWENEKI